MNALPPRLHYTEGNCVCCLRFRSNGSHFIVARMKKEIARCGETEVYVKSFRILEFDRNEFLERRLFSSSSELEPT